MNDRWVEEQRGTAPRRLFDKEQAGLMLRVGKGKLTWQYKATRYRNAVGEPLPKRESITRTLGPAGKGGLSVDRARKLAKAAIANIQVGKVPALARARREKKPKTVREALLAKGAKLSGRRGDREYRDAVASLGTLADRPVADLTHDMVKRWRDKVGGFDDSGQPWGEYGRARSTIKCLKAAWNAAGMPRHLNPCLGLSVPQRKVRGKLRPDDCPEWRRLSRQIANPQRRALILFMFLTGCRRSAARLIEWKDVHLDERFIHVANAKRIGMEESSDFDLPLSRLLVRFLRKLKRTNRPFGDTPYVFPSVDRHDRVVACCDLRMDPLPPEWSAERPLRKLYISRQGAAGIDSDAASFLVNHAVEGTRAHYSDPACQFDNLIEAQERMTVEMLRLCRAKK